MTHELLAQIHIRSIKERPSDNDDAQRECEHKTGDEKSRGSTNVRFTYILPLREEFFELHMLISWHIRFTTLCGSIYQQWM
jgi:hypothetical protein